MSSKSKLICITGMDGTGKSTLINALKPLMPGCSVAEIWDLMKEETNVLFKSKRDVDNYLCGLTPDSRVLFLAHAMKYSIEKAMTKPVVLINAYIYKYFAAELALGADPGLVQRLIDSFPQPDVVLCLQLSPREAAKRKEKYSRYECGLAEIPSVNAFISFQERAAKSWSGFAQNEWHVLEARKSPVELLQEVKQIAGVK